MNLIRRVDHPDMVLMTKSLLSYLVLFVFYSMMTKNPVQSKPLSIVARTKAGIYLLFLIKKCPQKFEIQNEAVTKTRLKPSLKQTK